MIPDAQRRAIEVAGKQAQAIIREQTSGEHGKPPAGVAADRVFVTHLAEIIRKFKSGAIDRAQAYKELLQEQQFRVDRWAVLHKAEAMAEQRIGKTKTTKAADAMRKETQTTLREGARAQKGKRKGKRDELRWLMNPHFDVLSKNRGMVKSPSKRGDEARAQSAAAQTAIDDLKAQLVARAETADAAAAAALTAEAEREAESLHAQEKERQNAITKYLQAQVDEGLLDSEMANMLADTENREHYDKYTKRIAREEVTGPAAYCRQERAVAKTTTDMPVRRQAGSRRAHVKGRKQFTRKQKAASKDVRRGLRPIVKWSEIGEPGAERSPVEEDDPRRQRIIGYKLPEAYLRQSRTKVAEYLTKAKKKLGWKLRGKHKGTQLPTRLNPYHNSVEENATLFMRQKLAFSAKPTVRRDTTAGIEEYAAKQRELGRTDKRGPERHLAGAKKGITGADENVQQKAHRTSNIHDAMIVLQQLQALLGDQAGDGQDY